MSKKARRMQEEADHINWAQSLKAPQPESPWKPITVTDTGTPTPPPPPEHTP